MGRIISRAATGKVIKYNSQRGYGFLTTMDVSDDIGLSEDAFFHISDVPASHVEKGWRFEFDLEENEKGYRAKNITIISREVKKPKERSKDRRMGIIRDDAPTDEEVKNPLRAEQVETQSSTTDKESSSDEGEEKSPFSDDIRGSKNDLLK